MDQHKAEYPGADRLRGGGENPFWNRNTPVTTTTEEARMRLEAILADRLLLFNPYRVSDRALLDCAERGRWSGFPAVTQMFVFHFHDLRMLPGQGGRCCHEGLFYHIGDSRTEQYFGVRSFLHPMSHRATLTPVWHLVGHRHLVASNISTLERKSVFISHALSCERINGDIRPAYRMHRLYGEDAKRAAIMRESMICAKLAMLGEVMRYAVLPEYLGNPCHEFDYVTPIRRVMDAIRRFPESAPPTVHITV